MSFFGKLFKGLGKVVSAPFKAVKSVVGLPMNLLKSAPSILKGTGSALKDTLGKLIPVAASAAPLLGAAVPGLGPILGMLGPALSSGSASGPTMSQHNRILADLIPRLSQQMTAGSPYLPQQWPLGNFSQGTIPGFGG
jgi:hypothetical protein